MLECLVKLQIDLTMERKVALARAKCMNDFLTLVVRNIICSCLRIDIYSAVMEATFDDNDNIYVPRKSTSTAFHFTYQKGCSRGGK